MCMYTKPPKAAVNLQLLIAYTPECQVAEVQGEDKRIPKGTCDCSECKEQRRANLELRQEQVRERCEADMDQARARRIRIYRWRRRRGFPLFYRSPEEREYLRARRQARMQK